MDIKKLLKWVVGLFGVIFLGAIGSGFWERCLSPFFNWLINLSVSAMSFLVSSYKDSIYLSAADGFHESPALFVQVLALGLLPTLYFSILIKHPQKWGGSGSGKFKDFVRSRKGYLLILFLTLSVFASFLLSAIKVSYINSVVTHSFKVIEVLSPHITDIEIKSLRAKFFSMKSFQDYESFKVDVNQKATKFGIVLPKLESIKSLQS